MAWGWGGFSQQSTALSTLTLLEMPRGWSWVKLRSEWKEMTTAVQVLKAHKKGRRAIVTCPQPGTYLALKHLGKEYGVYARLYWTRGV